MSLPLHKQPVHVAVRKQQEWADATARIRSLVADVPPALVEHFAKSLIAETTTEETPAPPPAEDAPPPEETEPPPPEKDRAATSQRRHMKRD